jgi:hypothetical protein
MLNFVKTIYWEISFMNYFNLFLMELLRSQKNNIGIGLTLNFTKKKRFNFIFCRHSIFPRSFDFLFFFHASTLYWFETDFHNLFLYWFETDFHNLFLYWFETDFHNLFQVAFYMVNVVLKKHSVIGLMLKFTKKKLLYVSFLFF